MHGLPRVVFRSACALIFSATLSMRTRLTKAGKSGHLLLDAPQGRQRTGLGILAGYRAVAGGEGGLMARRLNIVAVQSDHDQKHN